MISKKALLAILLAVCISLIAVVYFQSTERKDFSFINQSDEIKLANDSEESYIEDEPPVSVIIEGDEEGNLTYLTYQKRFGPKETPLNKSMCAIIDNMEPKELTDDWLESYEKEKEKDQKASSARMCIYQVVI